MSDLKQKIFDLLKQHPHGLTAQQIADAVGCNFVTVHSYHRKYHGIRVLKEVRPPKGRKYKLYVYGFEPDNLLPKFSEAEFLQAKKRNAKRYRDKKRHERLNGNAP